MTSMLIQKLRTSAISATLSFSLAACQTAGQGALPVSHAMAELSPTAAQAIAQDLAGKLTEHVAPGSSVIAIKSDGSSFGSALEAELTKSGYAVASTDRPSEGSDHIPLAYVIEEFDGQVLARLATKDLDLGRTYRVTVTGAAPSSPLSVKQRG